MSNEIPMVRKRISTSLKIEALIINVTGMLRTPHEKQIRLLSSTSGLPGELPKSSFSTTDTFWNNFNNDLFVRIKEIKNSQIELRKL